MKIYTHILFGVEFFFIFLDVVVVGQWRDTFNDENISIYSFN